MKKIMTALLCALGFSLVTQAERINGTNFEGLDVDFEVIGKTDDGSIGGGYWSNTVESVEALVATNTFTMVEVPPQEEGGDPTYEPKPDIAPYTGDKGYPAVHGENKSEKYLSINTKGGELVRNIQEGGTAQSIDGGIYFDSMVQFTATDALDANAGSESDKLILWLRDNRDGTTNLVVNAGYLNDQYEVESKDYVVLNSVQADKWYRLTIQAIAGAVGVTGKPFVGYAIYIDGEKACYKTSEAAFAGGSDYKVSSPYDGYLYNENVHALYPSLKGWAETGVNTFTAVAFSGVGAVDDIMFTTNAYDVAFTKPPASLTVNWTVGIASITINNETFETSGSGSTNLVGGTYTVSAEATTGYCVTYSLPSTTNIDATESEVTLNIDTVEALAEINGVMYATLADAIAAVGANGTVKLYRNNDLNDLEENTLTIDTENPFVLDLNGKVLSGGNVDGDSVLSVESALTIIDSIGGGAVSNTTDEAVAVLVDGGVDGGSLVIGLDKNDMGATFFGSVGAANDVEPLSIVRGNFYGFGEISPAGYVAPGSVGNMVEGCYVVAPVTFGLNPAVVELYYNCTSQISVVGAPEGATFYWQEEVIPGQSTGSGSISFSSDIKPLSVSSGRKTDTLKFYSNTTNGTWHLTAYVTNDNVQVAQFVANVVVKDVAAVVGGAEYTKAQLADAVADAIANDEVLGLYVDGPAVTLAAGQQIKVTALADKNKDKIGKLTVSGPVGTDGTVYVVQNTITDGVRTYSLTPEDPSVMFVSADGVTTNYFDASFKAAAAGTYKLLKNITRNQLSVGTAGVVLDLNGKTFTSTATGSTAAILVTSTIGTAGLTVVDSSDAGTGAIVAPNYSVLQSGKNGTVAVEGGSLSGKTVIVYTLSGGTAAISGGKFQMVSGSADSMLNCKDDNKGTISVTGGAFYGFDPANNNADGAGTDYVAEGYVSTADKPESGWFTVEEESVAPSAPVVDGQPVVPGEEFNTATTEKPITYPSTATVTGEVGNQTITYGTSGSVEVPAYYTASAEGNVVTLALNNNALATIGDATVAEEAKQAVEVGDTSVGVTLTTTNTKLYYGVQTCSTPDGKFTLQGTPQQGTGSAMQLSVTRGENETAKFYRLYVTDVAPAQN